VRTFAALKPLDHDWFDTFDLTWSNQVQQCDPEPMSARSIANPLSTKAKRLQKYCPKTAVDGKQRLSEHANHVVLKIVFCFVCFMFVGCIHGDGKMEALCFSCFRR
jgi:hypothetical protein